LTLLQAIRSFQNVTRHTEEIKPNRLTKASAARALGVTREHLSRVVHGHRQSRRLMAAWKKLLAEKST
jgi:hypothetical protein